MHDGRTGLTYEQMRKALDDAEEKHAEAVGQELRLRDAYQVLIRDWHAAQEHPGWWARCPLSCRQYLIALEPRNG